MKIVSIAWYKILPPVFGGQKGIACFNEYLSRKYPLVCLCSKDNETDTSVSYKVIPELPLSKTQFLNPFCWNKIATVAKQEQATHIILEHPYHGLAAYRAKKKVGAKLILHSHNIESERFREMGKRGWRILRSYEKWVHRKADMILFKTTADKNFAIRHFGVAEERCVIVPFGIDKKQPVDKEAAAQLIRQRHSIPPDQKIVLFAGTLDYAPNAEAVEAIYNHIAPELTSHYKIIICGRNKTATGRKLDSLIHPAVIRAGEVADIGNYFAAADVFINPVLQGGGIQTKNIEALSYHCNLVCFEHMADSDMLSVAGEKVLTARDSDWSRFVSRIMKAAIINKQTPDAFFEYYDWENIVQRLRL